jgi:hypothetical protein
MSRAIPIRRFQPIADVALTGRFQRTLVPSTVSPQGAQALDESNQNSLVPVTRYRVFKSLVPNPARLLRGSGHGALVFGLGRAALAPGRVRYRAGPRLALHFLGSNRLRRRYLDQCRSRARRSTRHATLFHGFHPSRRRRQRRHSPGGADLTGGLRLSLSDRRRHGRPACWSDFWWAP